MLILFIVAAVVLLLLGVGLYYCLCRPLKRSIQNRARYNPPKRDPYSLPQYSYRPPATAIDTPPPAYTATTNATATTGAATTATTIAATNYNTSNSGRTRRSSRERVPTRMVPNNPSAVASISRNNAPAPVNRHSRALSFGTEAVDNTTHNSDPALWSPLSYPTVTLETTTPVRNSTNRSSKGVVKMNPIRTTTTTVGGGHLHGVVNPTNNNYRVNNNNNNNDDDNNNRGGSLNSFPLNPTFGAGTSRGERSNRRSRSDEDYEYVVPFDIADVQSTPSSTRHSRHRHYHAPSLEVHIRSPPLSVDTHSFLGSGSRSDIVTRPPTAATTTTTTPTNTSTRMESPQFGSRQSDVFGSPQTRGGDSRPSLPPPGGSNHPPPVWGPSNPYNQFYYRSDYDGMSSTSVPASSTHEPQ
ncbi:hypothetical protein FRB91_011415 [Serendipita sp. 411]|nr:hypothetical protein FRB91_011415 [Serendipita sp. 411]